MALPGVAPVSVPSVDDCPWSPATLSGWPPSSESVAQLASELVAGMDRNHWPLCVGIRSPVDISSVVYMPSRGSNSKKRVSGRIPTQLSLNAVTARSGFVAEPQSWPLRANFITNAFMAAGVFAILLY